MTIDKKFAPVLFALFMSLIMPFIMTFFITLINAGFVQDFLWRWLKSSAIATVVAFPVMLLIAPRIRKFIEMITA